jgi:hypothetical protein
MESSLTNISFARKAIDKLAKVYSQRREENATRF